MLEITTHDHDVCEIRLARPPVNAMDPGLVLALRAALADAFKQGSSGVVISGAPGVFSAGLDIPVLLTLERDALTRFWSDFFGLLEDIAKAPVPVAAAMTGHSPAGGAVLSICCDYRIAAEGDFKIGLNEVQVGLIVPPFLHGILRHWVGAREAERMTVSGALISPADALAMGLVDELASSADVPERAVSWCYRMAALPRKPMLSTRRSARGPLYEAFERVNDDLSEQMSAVFFEPDTQAELREMVARLGSRQKS